MHPGHLPVLCGDLLNRGTCHHITEGTKQGPAAASASQHLDPEILAEPRRTSTSATLLISFVLIFVLDDKASDF